MVKLPVFVYALTQNSSFSSLLSIRVVYKVQNKPDYYNNSKFLTNSFKLRCRLNDDESVNLHVYIKVIGLAFQAFNYMKLKIKKPSVRLG